MGIIELGKEIAGAQEFIDRALAAKGYTTDIEGAVAKLRASNKIGVLPMLRRYRDMSGTDAVLGLERDRIEATAQADLSQIGHVKDLGLNAGTAVAFGASAKVTAERGLEGALATLPHIGPTAAEAAGHVTALLAKGPLAVAVPFAGEAYLALQAADSVVGTGMPLIDMRLTHAQKKAQRAAIEQVLDANRQERVDRFFEGVVGKIAEINPRAAELLGRTWNERTLTLAHEKQAVIGIENAFGKLGRNAKDNAFRSTRTAKNAARYIEAFFTDVTPDTLSDPAKVAEMLVDTNGIQAKGILMWPARSTTFNVLAVMAIGDINEMLKSNTSALTGNELTAGERAKLTAARDSIKQIGIELNTGFKGIPFIGFHRQKRFPWIAPNHARLFKDIMISRPVIRLNRVKPAAQKIQNEIVGLAGLLGTDQIELMTQFSQNLQLGFHESRSRGRKAALRRDALTLMNRFSDEILGPLQVTDAADQARIKAIESLEAHLIKYAAPQTDGTEYGFTNMGDNPITRAMLGKQIVDQVNRIIQAEYQRDRGTTKGSPTLGLGDLVKLAPYVLSREQRIRDASRERQIVEELGVVTIGSGVAFLNWLRGEPKSIWKNLVNQGKNFLIQLLPFDQEIKWFFNQVPFEKLVPGQ